MPPRARRFPDRISQDPELLSELFGDELIGHLGFVRDGAPMVMPTAVHLRPGSGELPRVLLHGSSGSGWLSVLSTGVPVCLTVTALDAVVVARSAFESSFHYRSALLFGTCRSLEGEELREGLESLTERIIPGRTAEVRVSTRRELAATSLLELRVEEWTYKGSHEWPDDPEDDVEGPAWAGVVPPLDRLRDAARRAGPG